MDDTFTMIIRNDDDTHRVIGSRSALQFIYEAITIAGMRDEDLTVVIDGREVEAHSLFCG